MAAYSGAWAHRAAPQETMYPKLKNEQVGWLGHSLNMNLKSISSRQQYFSLLSDPCWRRHANIEFSMRRGGECQWDRDFSSGVWSCLPNAYRLLLSVICHTHWPPPSTGSQKQTYLFLNIMTPSVPFILCLYPLLSLATCKPAWMPKFQRKSKGWIIVVK